MSSANALIVCNPNEDNKFGFSFVQGDLNQLNEQSSKIVLDQEAQITFEIDKERAFKESWFYGGVFDDHSKIYSISLFPASLKNTSEELNEKSAVFIQKIRSATNLNIKFKLKNGLEVEGSFDLSLINKGVEAFHKACKKLPEDE